MDIKKIICIIFAVVLLSVTVYGNYDDTLPRVIDNADLISNSEEINLQSRIDSIIENYGFDVVILTVDSCEGKTVVEFADDYFDYGGYGYGDGHDGILFLLNMGERDWYFSTCGYGITVFTDYGIQYIGEQILSYLSGGDYYSAFDKFLDYAEEFITQANSGTPYDINNTYSNSDYEYYYDPDYEYSYTYFDSLYVDTGVHLGFLIMAFVISLIFVLIALSKMNTIRFQKNANLYIKKDSLDIRRQLDKFLYSQVTRRRRETENSGGGGGSSTHTSSSGRSHGGGGGKF